MTEVESNAVHNNQFYLQKYETNEPQQCVYKVDDDDSNFNGWY